MKTYLVYLQLLTVSLLSSLACDIRASEDGPEEESDIDFSGSDCIWIRSIRDYTPLDDRTLIIWGGAKRPYHVSLVQRAREMRSSTGMSVESRDDRLCPYGGDALKFGNFNPYPVRVRSISSITVEQAEQLKARYGREDGDEPGTPEPQEAEGAEVEELD